MHFLLLLKLELLPSQKKFWNNNLFVQPSYYIRGEWIIISIDKLVKINLEHTHTWELNYGIDKLVKINLKNMRARTHTSHNS